MSTHYLVKRGDAYLNERTSFGPREDAVVFEGPGFAGINADCSNARRAPGVALARVVPVTVHRVRRGERREDLLRRIEELRRYIFDEHWKTCAVCHAADAKSGDLCTVGKALANGDRPVGAADAAEREGA